MALTNAERQKRFRDRLKAQASGAAGLYEIFVRERRETILAWMGEHEPGDTEHATLTAMLEHPDGGVDVEALATEFADLAGSIVRREWRKARPPRKRATRAEAAARRNREEASYAEWWKANHAKADDNSVTNEGT